MLWHSHKHEIESGLLQLNTKSAVPIAVADTAEQPAMLALYKTYGKTIHTWAIDTSPDLPLGPPNLMMSYTSDDQGPPSEMVKQRDETCGMDTQHKRELRAGHLPPYEKSPDADAWERTGKAVVFEIKEQDIVQ